MRVVRTGLPVALADQRAGGRQEVGVLGRAERCQVPADREGVIRVIGGSWRQAAGAGLPPGDPGIEVPCGRGGSADAMRARACWEDAAE